MKRLDGKVAIVFGAGPNIGGTVAHFFAREGARVAVSDVNPKTATATATFLTDRGFDALALTGNAFEEADVARIVVEAVSHYGHIDCVLNMAGRVHWSSVLDMKIEDWREAVLSFPSAGLLTTKHAAKAMIAGGQHGHRRAEERATNGHRLKVLSIVMSPSRVAVWPCPSWLVALQWTRTRLWGGKKRRMERLTGTLMTCESNVRTEKGARPTSRPLLVTTIVPVLSASGMKRIGDTGPRTG
jgi:NAD(P)-dependent dehydrogenase (short-subunit alcohol dehydrogenase family)